MIHKRSKDPKDPRTRTLLLAIIKSFLEERAPPFLKESLVLTSSVFTPVNWAGMKGQY